MKSLKLSISLAIIFQFVKCNRSGDFQKALYILERLVIWTFALDHHSYVRALPTYLRDMITLEERHPAVWHMLCAENAV